MRVVVLSSGSKGNTTYIESGKTRMLIDVGNSCKYVVSHLLEIGVDPSTINYIFITHTHSDHIKGLKVFLNKYHPMVFLGAGMILEMPYVSSYKVIDNDVLEFGDVKVHVIKTSHDAVDSMGYIVCDNDNSVVYVTDTGYIQRKYFELLSNRDIYIFESNHDIEMLNNGPYPFALRQRILGDKGHLSNYDSAKYLASFVGEKTKYILLAHLSDENNTYELAYETLMNRFNDEQKEKYQVMIAKQEKMSEVIDI